MDNPVESAWYFVAQFQMPLGYDDAIARLEAELARNPQLSKEAQERCLTDDARKSMAAVYERRADLIRKTLAWADENKTELAAECERDVADSMAQLGEGIHDECQQVERGITRAQEEKENRERRAAEQAQRDKGELPPLDEDERVIVWSASKEPLVRFIVPAEDWPQLQEWNSVSRDLADLRERAADAAAKAEKDKVPTGRGVKKAVIQRADESFKRAEELRATLAWAEGGGAARYPLPADADCAADIERAEGAQRGLARRYLIATAKGGVEVRIDASAFVYAQEDEEHIYQGVEVELRGESISETGYRSCGHQFDFDQIAADPFGFAQRVVAAEQEEQAKPPKKRRGRAEPVIEPDEEEEDIGEHEQSDEEPEAGGPAQQQGLFA